MPVAFLFHALSIVAGAICLALTIYHLFRMNQSIRPEFTRPTLGNLTRSELLGPLLPAFDGLFHSRGPYHRDRFLAFLFATIGCAVLALLTSSPVVDWFIQEGGVALQGTKPK